ncbi:MAG: class I SAM-dependent methyltransferase [Acidobacteriota bacterium]
MDEILRNLPAGARVLDLGCRSGSFSRDRYPGVNVVGLDRDPLSVPGVRADAAALPFADGSFDAIIANHSLEHMDRLSEVLREIGRVVKPEGSLFVSVPDASTVSDRLYRWVYHGGGHVNPFRSAPALAAEIARATGLPLRATRVLHTSFLFLERRHFQPRRPRSLWLVGYGNERLLAWAGYLARRADRVLGTRLSVYGWSFYFGVTGETVDTRAWPNVCVRCGTGWPAEHLTECVPLRREPWAGQSFLCPECGAWNLFTL